MEKYQLERGFLIFDLNTVGCGFCAPRFVRPNGYLNRQNIGKFGPLNRGHQIALDAAIGQCEQQIARPCDAKIFEILRNFGSHTIQHR